MIALLAATVIQGQLSFRSSNGAFELWNFDSATFEPPLSAQSPPTLHGIATGRPFFLRWLDRGIELEGRTGEVTAARSPEGEYALTFAQIGGGITLSQDSQRADAFFKRVSADWQKLVLTTDRIDLTGTSEQSTVAMAGRFQIEATSHRTRGRETTDQNIQAVASSGTVTFLTNPRDMDAIREGTILGPIQVTLDRTVWIGSQPKRGTHLEGGADRLDIDFISPKRTMTLTGNVSVKGHSDAYSGDTRAAKAVITFGPDGQITSIEMTGSPTTTQLKPHSGGQSARRGSRS